MKYNIEVTVRGESLRDGRQRTLVHIVNWKANSGQAYPLLSSLPESALPVQRVMLQDMIAALEEWADECGMTRRWYGAKVGVILMIEGVGPRNPAIVDFVTEVNSCRRLKNVTARIEEIVR